MPDEKTFAQRALEAVEAAILGRASDALLEQEVDGTKLKYMSMEQLLVARDKFKLMAEAESENGIVLPFSVPLSFR
jgi:hypothetical protein